MKHANLLPFVKRIELETRIRRDARNSLRPVLDQMHACWLGLRTHLAVAAVFCVVGLTHATLREWTSTVVLMALAMGALLSAVGAAYRWRRTEAFDRDDRMQAFLRERLGL